MHSHRQALDRREPAKQAANGERTSAGHVYFAPREGHRGVSLRSVASALRQAYLELDPRSLGLGRIGLGLLLLVDLFRRVPWIRDIYSNSGLLPNHTVLWRPPSERLFSLFFCASLPDEVALLFVFAGICFSLFLIGYRTRLFHLLSLMFCVSLHNRVVFIENGGAVATVCVLLWTAFMPLGARFSLDALLRERRRASASEPTEASVGAPADRNPPFRSLVVPAFLLQLSAIYYFNFVHKSGPTWHDGTAVHYVLWQERIVTHLGLWVREQVPFAITRALTHGTLLIEASAPLLLLLPVGWRVTRPIALLALASLHIGIALLVNVGVFSAAMLSFYPFLLARAHWDWLERRRILTGALCQRVRAAARRLATRLEPLLAWLAARRPPSPAASLAGWRRGAGLMRELLVALTCVIVLFEVLVANPAVPRTLKFNRPDWMVAPILYTHLFEGWSMFAPDAPRSDMMVFIDAVTRDGRHIDPLNQIGSRSAVLPVRDIPPRLGHDSFFCDYTLRVPDATAYHQAFTEWILRYPQRTGSPADEIVSFEAHVVEHTSPAPGEPAPSNVRDRVFLRFPSRS